MGKIAKVAMNVAFAILGGVILSGSVEAAIEAMVEKAKE